MARGPGNGRKAEPSNGEGDNGNGAFEAKLWATADALRNNMDAAEYKHAVLGLIFLNRTPLKSSATSWVRRSDISHATAPTIIPSSSSRARSSKSSTRTRARKAAR